LGREKNKKYNCGRQQVAKIDILGNNLRRILEEKSQVKVQSKVQAKSLQHLIYI
jgi:hypothetical protein